MWRNILCCGGIAGLIAGGVLFGMTVTLRSLPPPAWGMAIGYLTMLAAFSLIVVAIRRQRDRANGGVIGFRAAFGLGLGVSVVASLLYVLAWEAAVAVTGIDFGSAYANVMIAQRKADCLAGEALDRYVASMEQFKTDYANPLYRLPMTFSEIFPVGVLVSLIAAALLRRRQPAAPR